MKFVGRTAFIGAWVLLVLAVANLVAPVPGYFIAGLLFSWLPFAVATLVYCFVLWQRDRRLFRRIEQVEGDLSQLSGEDQEDIRIEIARRLLARLDNYDFE